MRGRGVSAGRVRRRRAFSQRRAVGGALLHLHALAHVLLQRASHAERHAAELAVVHVLARAAVRAHVARQFRALCACVGTQLALVWFLAGVGAPVHRQVRAVAEHLQKQQKYSVKYK